MQALLDADAEADRLRKELAEHAQERTRLMQELENERSARKAAKKRMWELGHEVEAAEARAEAAEQAQARLREALQRVADLLPGPVWNEHRVLVWSMHEVDEIAKALADPATKGSPTC